MARMPIEILAGIIGPLESVTAADPSSVVVATLDGCVYRLRAALDVDQEELVGDLTVEGFWDSGAAALAAGGYGYAQVTGHA